MFFEKVSCIGVSAAHRTVIAQEFQSLFVQQLVGLQGGNMHGDQQRLNVFGRRPVFGSPLEPAVHDQFYFFLIFGITLVRFLLLHIHFDRIDELSGGDGLHIIAYVFADEGASSRAGKLNHKSFFCTHNKKLLKYILNVFSRSDSECASCHHLRCV